MPDFSITAVCMLGPTPEPEAGKPPPRPRPVFWEIGKPIPNGTKPNTEVDRMMVVGAAVDVFIRETVEGGGQTGTHVRLPSPHVLYLIESAEREVWRAEMDAAPGTEFGLLTDPFGRPWARNASVPGVPATITRIVVDLFEVGTVFALPNPGTKAAERGVAFRVTFFPNTNFLCMTEGLLITDWLDLQEFVEDQARRAAEGELDEPEPEEPEEPEEEEPVAAPAATNGAPVATVPAPEASA
jgi:hypothetical protein